MSSPCCIQLLLAPADILSVRLPTGEIPGHPLEDGKQVHGRGAAEVENVHESPVNVNQIADWGRVNPHSTDTVDDDEQERGYVALGVVCPILDSGFCVRGATEDLDIGAASRL